MVGTPHTSELGINVPTSISEQLKRELAALGSCLPSRSDRSHAASLATWHGELTERQQSFARILLERARKFEHSGPKGTDEDIWSSAAVAGADQARGAEMPLPALSLNEQSFVASGNKALAINALRLRTHCSRETALGTVERYERDSARPASSAPALPKPQVELPSGSELEEIVKRILEPGLANVAEQVERNAQLRQDSFNRSAAKAIAEQVASECTARVTRAMIEELDRRKPREVIIRAERDGIARTVEGLKHKSLETALSVVAANIPLLLVGPAGGGKSMAGEQISQALGLPFFMWGAASGTHEYLGYKDGAGAYHTTPFREAFERGGLFMAEELDSGSADVPLILNAALANGHMAFPDRAEPVVRHNDFRIVANANTYGTGADRIYVGRTQLDGATIDRFAFLDWAYDEELELACSSNEQWTRKVQRIRAAVSAERARIIVSPRASILGGKLLAQGLSEKQVLEMIIWKGVDSALRAKVEARI